MEQHHPASRLLSRATNDLNKKLYEITRHHPNKDVLGSTDGGGGISSSSRYQKVRRTP